MERRKSPDRRREHVFVSQDRRQGPYDRRGVEARLRTGRREREKIERIRAFKKKEPAVSPAPGLLTGRRLVTAALIVLILVAAILLLR